MIEIVEIGGETSFEIFLEPGVDKRLLTRDDRTQEVHTCQLQHAAGRADLETFTRATDDAVNRNESGHNEGNKDQVGDTTGKRR